MERDLVIQRNEWASLAEARAALAEFPWCGTCKSSAKIQNVRGRWLTLCIHRPEAHNGVGRTQKGRV